MNLQDTLIITLASLVGLIYLFIIRSYDIYEKESFLKLLFVAIFGGIIAATLSSFCYEFIEINYNFVDAVFKIGPIEEISKLLALVIIYNFFKSDFNEIVDGLIYIAAISLGFAVFENILYALKSTDPFSILILRSFYSVIGHIAFSGYLGLAFFIHVKIKRNFIGIFLSIILASLAHGIYDGIIFHQELGFLFRFVFAGLVGIQFLIVRTVLGFSTFRKDFSLDLFTSSEKTIFIKCCKCDSSIKDIGLKFWKINGVICKNCNSIVFQGENLGALFKYYRPAIRFQDFCKELPKEKNTLFLDENEVITFNWQRTILSSPIPELSKWLKDTNNLDRQNILQKPIIGNLLMYLGIRFL